jgi:hypothetical protein
LAYAKAAVRERARDGITSAMSYYDRYRERGLSPEQALSESLFDPSHDQHLDELAHV